MYFDFSLPFLSYALFSIAFVALVYICLFTCRVLYKLRRHKSICDDLTSKEIESGPFASIIIFARSESESLLRNVPKILKQDYKPGFEIIIVNEGASEETSMAVGMLKKTYAGKIYLTYTPDGARNLSRKKLGLTLGVKAAKGDVVLISDANAQILSDHWLADMMRPFENPATEVVLGWGAPDFSEDKFLGRLSLSFDILADSVAWLTAALRKQPYRGCGFNLAYRRQLFFDNKGFSRSLNLREGDDDIFVNEITNKYNTEVVISEASMVNRETLPFKKGIKSQRLSHFFTGKRLPKMQRRLLGVSDWLLWILILCCIAAALICNPLNAVGWIGAGIFIIAAVWIVSYAWHHTLLTMRLPSSSWAIPFLVLGRPFRNAKLRLRSVLKRQSHYTWQK